MHFRKYIFMYLNNFGPPYNGWMSYSDLRVVIPFKVVHLSSPYRKLVTEF